MKNLKINIYIIIIRIIFDRLVCYLIDEYERHELMIMG